MPYDLKAIEDFCRSERLSCERISPEELRVRFGRDFTLCIANTEGGTDTYLGFSDGAWHTHGEAMFMTGPDTYLELDPVEVLAGLRAGDLLIGSRYVRGELKDRWIFHRKEKQDFQYFEDGESVTVRRADPAGTDNFGG
jgi:hypothetical protein